MAQGIGQQDLAYRQAVQDAKDKLNQMAAFEPIDRIKRFGQGLTGVWWWTWICTNMTGPAAPQQSPLGTCDKHRYRSIYTR